MATVRIASNRISGKIKPMHAVNNGPVKGPRMFPLSGNFDAFREAGIPYVRNHDASFCASYGGEHTVDITAVFPNFDADPYDPASYDFPCTDNYTETILEAGAEVFYRLGQKIDHRVKKYDSIPPKDYKKWAIICEHIIRHYNCGWADGFHFNIVYWEIWNEPGNGRECWDAPLEDFYPLFEITAKHLKACFPELKIGGPAFATGHFDKRTDEFLSYMRDHNVPMDFYSWHTYRSEVDQYEKRMLFARERLDFYGYTQTESILNEWNYIKNWKEGLLESKKAIISMKGAAFTSALMATGQALPLDMLMYYDARVNATLNGLFNFYTYEKMKGYYPFYLFSKLYKLGGYIKTVSDTNEIYAVAAKNGESLAIMLTYFTNSEELGEKEVTVKLDGCRSDEYALYLLDDAHDADHIGSVKANDGVITLTMSPNSVVLLEK